MQPNREAPAELDPAAPPAIAPEQNGQETANGGACARFPTSRLGPMPGRHADIDGKEKARWRGRPCLERLQPFPRAQATAPRIPAQAGIELESVHFARFGRQ